MAVKGGTEDISEDITLMNCAEEIWLFLLCWWVFSKRLLHVLFLFCLLELSEHEGQQVCPVSQYSLKDPWPQSFSWVKNPYFPGIGIFILHPYSFVVLQWACHCPLWFFDLKPHFKNALTIKKNGNFVWKFHLLIMSEKHCQSDCSIITDFFRATFPF